MNPLRLLIVTPRYWPLAGEMERGLTLLAEGLHDYGVQSTVLTAAWAGDWPCQFVHREVPVHRLPHAPQGGWHTLRFLRSVSRWLRDHRSEFDLVYVARLRNEAYAAVGALLKTSIPVLLRCGEHDCEWQQQARFGRRIKARCQQAEAIIVSNQRVGSALVEAGYDRPVIHHIPWGVPIGADRSSAARSEARRTLAAANHDLAASDVTPIVVCVTRLDDSQALQPLIQAWQTIAKRWPSAKLWLIGDGPRRHDLYEVLVYDGLHRDCLMPGSFDELGDVFQAADLSVTVHQSIDETPALLQAMAAGLPLIAAATQANRDILAGVDGGLLLPQVDPSSLAAAISGLLETPDLAARLAAAARRIAGQQYSLDTMALLHRQLFDQLVINQRTSR